MKKRSAFAGSNAWVSVAGAGRFLSLFGAALALIFAASGDAVAADGAIPIDSDRALAGGVTATDTPGWPVTLDTPGSYVLTGRLIVPNENTTAIEVTGEDVTIDLNGFKMEGPVGCTGSGSTLNCTPAGTGVGIQGSTVRGTTVRNGLVRGFGSHAVNLGDDARVEDVSVHKNAGSGIVVGDGGLVSGCQAIFNGGVGIQGQSATNVEHNQVHHNKSDGIQLAVSGRVSGNIVRNSGDDGIQAFSALVEDNAVFEVADEGIFIPVGGEGGLVRGNSVRSNGSIGINANTRTGYTHNSLNSNGSPTNGGVNMGSNNCSGSLCP